MQCIISRRKLVTHGTMSFDGSPMKETGKSWVTEPCGTPLFGGKYETDKVCRSCLKGWTHEHNYMLDTEENKKLIEEAKKEKGLP